MSKLNFLLLLNAYSDSRSSNSPQKQNFKWTKELNSFPVLNPISESISLAPGQSISLISGVRALNQDNTTEYSIAPVSGSTTQYRLSWVTGTAPNFRTPRSIGADATTEVSVSVNGPVATFDGSAVGTVAAYFSGTLGGMTTPVTIVADNLGTAGNSINIALDGFSDVNTLIAGWNTDNPDATVTLTSGDGTQIATGGSFQFANGEDSTPFNLGGVSVGDNVIIGNNFNQLNRGQFSIISLTNTTFSVVNASAVNEGPIILGSGYSDQVQVFSAAGVQVGDTIKISGGFSPVSWGSYEILQVSAESLVFSSVNALPTEGPITTQAIAIYSDAKQLVYVECDQPCILTINGVATDAIEPFISGSSSSPGVFLRKSTIYSMSIANSSINTANIFFACCE